MLESYRHRKAFRRGARLLGDERWDDALAEFDRAAGLRPGDSWSHNNRAIALFKLGRLEDAAAAFQRAIHLNPGFAESHENRAAALAQLERFEEAATVYGRALALEPDNASSHLNLGLVLHRLARFEEAAGAFQRAIHLNPGSAEAHENRAAALAQLERFEEAATVYERALALEPDNASSRLNLGLVLHRLARFEEAAAALGAALGSTPGSPPLHAVYGQALANLGRHEEAVAALQRAIQRFPEAPDLRASLAAALTRLERYEEAEQTLRVALERSPGSAELQAGLAELLLRQLRFPEAVDALRVATALSPEAPQLHVRLADALGWAGCPEEALTSLGRALALAPGDAGLHVRQANALMQLERWAEAAAAYQGAIEHEPDCAAHFRSLGAALFRAGVHEGAAAAYRRALTLEPEHAEAYTNLATVLTRLEPSEEVLEGHRQLAELSPDDAAAQLGLGIAALQLGRHEQAVAALERAAALSAGDATCHFLQVDPLLRLGRGEQAAAAHRRALALGGALPELPGEPTLRRFEARRRELWSRDRLAPEVFRVEAWLERLAVPAAASEGPRLLFVLDNDYGELTTLMYLGLGQPLLGRTTLLLPERLVAQNAGAVPGRTHRYASAEDVLRVVDAERPAVVFLCSGYLFSIHQLLSLEALEGLVAALRERGCRVVTTDPFLGMLSREDPRTLVGIDIPERSDELDIEEMRRVKAVEDERLRSDFTRAEAIFRDAPHLYPSYCDVPPEQVGPSDARNLDFFNAELICPELVEGQGGGGRRHWLFILSRTDYETQMMFEGAAFRDVVARMLVDALAAGRHPILIAPDELVAAVISRMPTVEGADILTFCPFNRMISLLLTAEHAFYWNVVSHSILVRLFNQRPVVLFDRGHLVRNVPAMLPRVVQWYYQGLEPAFRDHHEALTLDTLAAWTAEQRARAAQMGERFRRAPTPEQMIARIAAGPAG